MAAMCSTNALLCLLGLSMFAVQRAKADILQSVWATFTSINPSFVIQQNGGARLVLNDTLPAFTLSPNANCTSASSCADYLVAALANVYEEDASGVPVQGRNAASMLDLAASSWSVHIITTGSPVVTMTTANFTIPFVSSPPACPGGGSSVFPPLTNGTGVFLETMIPSGDTNLTMDGQNVELLGGNVKWNVRIDGWPFCNTTDSLVIGLLMASANTSSQPSTMTSQDLSAEMNQQEQQLQGNVTAGNGTQAGAGGLNLHFPGNIQRPIDAVTKALYPPIEQHVLQNKLLMRRAVYGMGQRNLSSPGVFLFFPPNNHVGGNSSIQAKVDVPATAFLAGILRNVTVTTPLPQAGTIGQPVMITLPASQTILYDPTATINTTETQINSIVNGALQNPPLYPSPPPSPVPSPPPPGSPPPPANGAAMSTTSFKMPIMILSVAWMLL